MEVSERTNISVVEERPVLTSPDLLRRLNFQRQESLLSARRCETGFFRLILNLKPNKQTARVDSLKRLFDIVGALALLTLLSPVFLVVAFVVKITSRGPILFRQKRVGLRGERFSCFKFRTMVVNAEELLLQDGELRKQYQAGFKIRNDPRVTRFGLLLRKMSIDELPQLFNVLKGEMSLIGPRPLIGPELDEYGSLQNKLLSVKPGLGCVWQVCGRSETSWAEHVEMDLLYVDCRSIWLDFQLLVLTAMAIFKGRGAY